MADNLLRRYSIVTGAIPAAGARKRSNIAKASSGVEESGTVGPEAIRSSGSPNVGDDEAKQPRLRRSERVAPL